MCSTTTAAKLGLELTKFRRNFRGLGRAEGVEAHPVEVKLLPYNRVGKVSFHVIPQKEFDTVLSVNDLAQFKVVIDPESHSLVPKEVRVSCNTVKEEKPVVQSSNTVSGVDETKSDEELLKEARMLYNKNTTHMSDQAREEIWNLFMEFKDMWIRPTSG